ncbi:serine kinase [Caldimonas brevitalea]|uniref:Serine kinase n=1 Tax=Caldimonas brevitalea TaxID=413882 RepID=A0A0G3BXI0_9BURK|nr:serine kinase [Caldimonas brevitalea]AKJ32076.1 serine kinase [Caldimonas brevitalea]
MDIDWKRLIDVRERQKRTAMETVARDREAAERSLADARQAQARLQQEMAAKAQHWQATAGALQDGHCSVAELRHAGAWSGALDARIVEAGRGAARAQAAHLQRQQVLDASRRQLRAASGDVEKAQQMHRRCQSEQRRLQEARLDDVAEDVAAQAWAARRKV